MCGMRWANKGVACAGLPAEQHSMQHNMHVAAKNTNPTQQVHAAATAEDYGLFVLPHAKLYQDNTVRIRLYTRPSDSFTE
jgi:hypothetical protein